NRILAFHALAHLGEALTYAAHGCERRAPNHPPPFDNLRWPVLQAESYGGIEMSQSLLAIIHSMVNPTDPEYGKGQARRMCQALRQLDRLPRLLNCLVHTTHNREQTRQHAQRAYPRVQHVKRALKTMAAGRVKIEDPLQHLTRFHEASHKGECCSQCLE